MAYGDTWTWTGRPDGDYAMDFMDDLRSRLANCVQLTSDGRKAYLEAVERAFGGDIDYAMLVKLSYAERQNLTMRMHMRDITG